MSKAVFDSSAVGVANLLELAPIAPGAVVSKPLVQTPGAKVILFAMDQGQSISEHHAPYVVTVHVLDGRLDFGVAGQRHELAAHDWMVLPFDERHDLEALQPTRFLLTLVKQS